MKTTSLKLICSLLFLTIVAYSFAQVSCSGTIAGNSIPTCGTKVRIGNGTPGSIRVCMTAEAMGTASCMGLTQAVYLYNTSGTLVGRWSTTGALTTFNSGTTISGSCFTMVSTNGYADLCDWCADSGSGTTFSWTTVDAGGVDQCCTPNCSNGIQDCTESGIDCGTGCPSPCPGVASCTDAIQNQDETGVDCGGTICPACGATCTTWESPSMVPAAGSIIDARSSNQTITTCVSVRYSNASTNWVHGIYSNPASTGFVSSTGTTKIADVTNMGTTYTWRNQTATFTSSNSGNSITADGWFVDTGDGNPGNNLGWPVGANTLLGPFCFSTVVGCSGLTGDVAATIGFATTADSYSGSWTSNGCGLNTSVGTSAQMSYTLRCPVTLPIELLEFEGTNAGKENQIKWTTSTEQNNEYFLLMKSTDGETWEEFEKIKGGGTTVSEKTYRAIDKAPGENITYYKLRQFDIDGEMKESHLIGVISSSYFKDLTLIPNPVEDQAMLIYSSTENVATQLTIVDISGKVIQTLNFDTFKGINKQVITTEMLNTGMYYLEIKNDFETKKIRFVK